MEFQNSMAILESSLFHLHGSFLCHFLLGYFLPRKVLLGNHNAKEWDQSFYVVIPSHPTKQKVDGTIPSHLVPKPNSC